MRHKHAGYIGRMSADMRAGGWQDVACSGKVAFSSFKLAADAARNRRRANVEQARVAYHCSHCHKYHLGSQRPPAGRDSAQRRRLLERDAARLERDE